LSLIEGTGDKQGNARKTRAPYRGCLTAGKLQEYQTSERDWLALLWHYVSTALQLAQRIERRGIAARYFRSRRRR